MRKAAGAIVFLSGCTLAAWVSNEPVKSLTFTNAMLLNLLAATLASIGSSLWFASPRAIIEPIKAAVAKQRWKVRRTR